ncbi:Post-SET domain [Ostreococcus tauri]|uniref:Post-SET domain n=1 Tax=Ostreococcus tauri TaxID=70448 RepID=A0A096P8X3_OSTTA|nr:Post-SET domain [Ostreococcus tauri]CEG00672.1 Post-SET domain [Ostreococcus tauri]|eukprot:XP_022840513.1 Post-SET domain [Ostreococcus tauri]
MTEDETTYEIITYDNCRVNDFCIIESGEPEKWQGQIKSKNDGKLAVRWLRPWEPKSEREDIGVTGLYDWDPHEMCQIDVETLIEIGPALFHKARRPGFEPKGPVYCLASTCDGRCALAAPRHKKERVIVVKEEDAVVDAERPRYLLPVPDTAVEWQPNVMGECLPSEVPGSPFCYSSARHLDGETEKCAEKAVCFCKHMHSALGRRLASLSSDLHAVNGGSCPSAALTMNKIIHSFHVKNTPKKGFGIFARENIQRGAFLFEYAGEIINRSEAYVRERKYIADGKYYMHDIHGLKKHISHAQFTIDPTSHGNIGRFLNHSCCPNVSTVELLLSDDLQEVLNVFTAVPRVCFMAVRDIEAGEELCIDYVPHIEDASKLQKKINCQCGEAKCREYVF